jgi:hypothetical protein
LEFFGNYSLDITWVVIDLSWVVIAIPLSKIEGTPFQHLFIVVAKTDRASSGWEHRTKYYYLNVGTYDDVMFFHSFCFRNPYPFSFFSFTPPWVEKDGE